MHKVGPSHRQLEAAKFRPRTRFSVLWFERMNLDESLGRIFALRELVQGSILDLSRRCADRLSSLSQDGLALQDC